MDLESAPGQAAESISALLWLSPGLADACRRVTDP
jgi:hypothetical protein